MENFKKMKSPKMKQTTLNNFLSPITRKLQGYEIQSGEWLGKNETKYPERKDTQSKPRKKLNESTEKNSKDLSKSWRRLQETFPIDTQVISKVNSHTQKESKDCLLLTKSESFETYGMVLPSVDKILDNINQIKKDAKALDEYEQLYAEDDDSFTEYLKNLVDKDTSPLKNSEDSLLDCKHLSQKEIRKHFKSNLDYVRDIQSGVQYSDRHQVYKNFARRSELTYNTSTIVFSSNQTEYLLRKLEEKLDPDSNNTEYIMMVLLPEMCLRIFMDVFEMPVKKALDYLDWRPLD